MIILVTGSDVNVKCCRFAPPFVKSFKQGVFNLLFSFLRHEMYGWQMSALFLKNKVNVCQHPDSEEAMLRRSQMNISLIHKSFFLIIHAHYK